MKRTFLALLAASALALSGATTASAEEPQGPSLTVTDAEITYGEAATITATATNAPTDSSIVFKIDGAELASAAVTTGGIAEAKVPAASTPAGAHTISASLVDAADSSIVLADATAILTVKKATTKVVVWLEVGAQKVTGNVSGQYRTVPTGEMSLRYNGDSIGTLPIPASGKFEKDLPQTVTVESARSLSLDYAGDVNHTGAKASGVPVMVDPYPCSSPQGVGVFTDVPVTHKFFTEIDWMHCMGYSTGWRQPNSKPLYKPADNLSRAAMAAFIFRLEASHDYEAPKVSPFADVKPGDPFYKEIAWMHEQRLSTGYKEASGKPTYRPTANLSREAMAAFIYRLEKPTNFEAPMVSPLADMKPGMKFYTEIAWMYEAKLTTGNKTAVGKEYWPKSELSRQAMAAFIYRLVNTYR